MEEKADRFQSLYDAILMGDEATLLNMLGKDPLILGRCMIKNAGNLKQSPLHIAARKGNLGIVKTLLSYEPNMCFTQDKYGRNPIHVASIDGHLEVLQELIHANPEAAREQTNKGETFLHLCISHGHKEGLKGLLDLIDGKLLNAKDSKGDTVLHYAVRSKQFEMVRVILEDMRININALNKDKLTAMDTHMLLIENQMGHCHKSCLGKIINWKDDDDIGPYLEDAKALRAEDALKIKHTDTWVESKSNGLMVVASLIATMAFTLAISPPGGSWQDPSKGDDFPPGVGIIYTENEDSYIDPLLIANSVAFCSSLSVILLLISGLPNGRPMVLILMVTMWIAIAATTVTYTITLLLIIDGLTKATNVTQTITIIVWGCLVGLLIFAHLLLFVVKFVIRRCALRSKMIKSCRAHLLCIPCIN